ncbi:hypothetical protein [Paenibacillus donghaensis]|uniref:Uncharacterized protein n=1 Tax=Paenibacillus donghaensis TaxID=414771 RepID=A0A2Z2KAB4_9BACL|nr:hypothetical protein [Paenibacillus donghaensis]ASA22524.1 hypothetical protein B9T62_18095 [Paenibacillus donghaensis]
MAGTTVNSFRISELGLSDEVLAFAELEKDPLFHKIAPGKYSYYIARSLEMGRAAAVPLQGQPVRCLLEQAGVAFEIKPASGSSALRLALRAQLDFSGRTPWINVYQDSMEQLREAALAGGGAYGALSLDEVMDIHLAHEYYHLLEYRADQFTSDVLEPVECMRIGPFRRQAAILQASEIAAHAFCKELLNLPYLPSLLDNIYVWQTSKLERVQIQEIVGRWKAIVGER